MEMLSREASRLPIIAQQLIINRESQFFWERPVIGKIWAMDNGLIVILPLAKRM